MKRSAALLGAVLALAIAGCDRAERDDADDDEVSARSRVDADGQVVLSSAERAALDLQTAGATRGELETSRLRFGKVIGRPQEDAAVTAPVTARLIAPVSALGAKVAAGDVLLTLEALVEPTARAALQAQRHELQGQLTAARAQVDAKLAELQRVTALATSGLANSAERAQADAELSSERARVDSLGRAVAELARTSGGRLELRAPVAGVVAQLASDAGALVAQGTLLARVVREGPRWIDLAVPPDDPLGTGYRVQSGTSAIAARLLARGAVIEPDGTRRDRLEIDADAGALPGQIVPVEVLRTTSGLLIATSALLRRGGDSLVFVEVRANTFAARRVAVAAGDDARVALGSGVREGERVVTQGAASLLGELAVAQQRPDAGAAR